MNFWKSFSKKAVLKQLCFVLFIFALLIPVAIWDSDTQVKVKFYDTEVYIKSDKYAMTIPYDIIDSAELVALPEPGEETDDNFDNDIIRTGKWIDETWGEYYICADLDADNGILVHLNDGRVFIFSRKNNEATAEDLETLLSYLTIPEN